MTQLFKTMNSRTISQYFTCYCNNVISMPIRYSCVTRIRNVTFVKRLSVHTSYLTLVYDTTN